MTAHIVQRYGSISQKVVTAMSELSPLPTPAQLPALTPSLVSGIRSFEQGLPHSIGH